MSGAEAIIGLIASVFAILAGLTVAARYLAKKFDVWTESVIDNSRAIRQLSGRVMILEKKINDSKNDV